MGSKSGGRGRSVKTIVCLGTLAGAVGAQTESTTQPQSIRTEEVIVRGRQDSLIGIAESSSQGTVGAAELERRPLLRPGEVLETVPGLIATQHSGAGKANQFFLRGFNLDHGTDFATDVNGMPVNLPTHAHGQGYTDLNFLIPELVERVNYKKGPYFADEGDFASAGAADIDYFTVMPHGIFRVEGGSFGYARTLLADSPELNGGHLLYGVELFRNDGPWDHPDDFEKINGVLRYSRGNADMGFSVTGMAYKASWDATDQVAERAIGGSFDRFDSLDESTGGDSQRYSLSAEAHFRGDTSFTTLAAFAYYYDLDLYSNFTYFLNDPVNGDQFLQSDRRIVSGFRGAHTIYGELFGAETEHTFGVQLRNDAIDDVGLFSTAVRDVLSTTRRDQVSETSLGLFYENKTQWNDKVRTTLGLRGDFYYFDVDSDLAANSGHDSAAIFSPKAGIVFGPFNKTEIYLNGGLGFHSNDARGVTTTVDPATGDPVDEADPLVRTKGAEVGLRTLAVKNLQSTVSLWILELDSELLFVGDAGTTDISRPSRRYGVEWANFYTPSPGLTFDLDLSLSHARFTDSDPAGDYIPGSIETVIAAGVFYEHPKGYFGGLRLRYLGPRPLIEDDSVESDSTCLVSAELGYHFNDTWTIKAEFFNLLDQEENDIEYFYASRLAGEPAGPDEGGFNDIHLHPAEPFAVRIGLTAQF